jgi:preprotein translocase subunit YajC
MHLLTILAQEDDSAGGGAVIVQLGILLLIPLAMYFLMIRPQRRRMREQVALQSALEVGDEVILTSGMYGFITGFDTESGLAWIEIDDDVQIRVARASIQGKIDTSGASEAVARPEGDRDELTTNTSNGKGASKGSRRTDAAAEADASASDAD